MNIIEVYGNYNQNDLKTDIRRQYDVLDNQDADIHLKLKNNTRMQNLFSTISIPRFFEKVKILEIRDLSALRNISGLSKFLELEKFIYTDTGESRRTFELPTNLNKLEHIEFLKGINIKITSFSHYPNLKTFINLKN